MSHDASPAARALVALAVIQNNPASTAHRLGERLAQADHAEAPA